MSVLRAISRRLGGVRQGGFYSALVKEFGDPTSKMAGLSGVLLGMGERRWNRRIWVDYSSDGAIASQFTNLIYTYTANFAGNPLLDITAVVDQPLLDKYGVRPCAVAALHLFTFCAFRCHRL